MMSQRDLACLVLAVCTFTKWGGGGGEDVEVVDRLYSLLGLGLKTGSNCVKLRRFKISLQMEIKGGGGFTFPLQKSGYFLD